MGSVSRRLLAAPVCAILCAISVTAARQAPSGPAHPAAATSAQTPPACPDGSGQAPLYHDTQYSPGQRAADLVSCMTLREKTEQLSTNNAPAIPRLGVQQYTYWNEEQHGIFELRDNTDGGGTSVIANATSFPTNLAATMSWDPGLMQQETAAISEEARGFLDKSLWGTGQNNLGPSRSDYGSLTYWAPTVNMDRDPRWGRANEAFGEDPELASKMAGAYVDGDQGQDLNGKSLTGYLKVAATAKHLALNNIEGTRLESSSNTSDANLRDYYTAQFRNLIEKAHVSGLMTALNAVNGTPAVADTYTGNALAQRTYGFNGYTTTDCIGVRTIYRSAPLGHDWAPPGWTSDHQGDSSVWTNTATGRTVTGQAGAEAYTLRGGSDLNCLGEEPSFQYVKEAIKAGILSEGVIDNALVHLFTVRMETGEFDPPSKVPYTKISKDVIQSPAHQTLARKVADQSLVLLKNDNVPGTAGPLLPASPDKLHQVVILGDLAGKVSLGNYSGNPSLQVSAVQGVTDAVKAADPGASVVFDACGTSTTATAPASCSPQTQADIKSADLVIVFVGTDQKVASEGLDETTLAMPGNYDSLINQTAALGNHKMALVIQSNGPVTIGNVQADFPAIVFSAYNGESQGSALADVLFGQQNPAGHLDFTWYKDDSQLPGMQNYGLTPSQTGGLGRTYEYFTGTPTYPFGYGLSYTNFKYSHLSIASRTVDANATVPVTFDVTNTGTTPGATVAQLYAAPQFTVPGTELPREQLAGFQRTDVLAPGQTQHITLRVKLADLSHWDENSLKQVVYDGPYQFRVGPDAATAAGTGTVTVTGALAEHVQHVTVQPDQVVFTPGQSLDLTGKNPWIAPDTNSSLEQPHASADNIVEAVNNDQSFVNLGHAHVRYTSSNDHVATVSAAGKVTMIGHGVATISATVGGVTGSAPIVVQPPFTIDAPHVAPSGTDLTVTTSLPNRTSQPVNNVTITLTVPSGWTATAASPATFSQIPPGQSAQTTWRVTVPVSAQPGTQQLEAAAAFADANSPGTATTSTQTPVPYPSLASAFDSPGISDDSNPAAGNLNGAGLSYSAQALSAGTPSLTPGATITHGGQTFTWPSASPATPDNTVAAGQAIALTGSGDTLGLLGASDNGTATGTGTIIYTDGTVQPFTFSFADWQANTAAPGGDILTTVPYLNSPTGRRNQAASVYYASVPLQKGKTVQYVVFPYVTKVVPFGSPAAMPIHIFAAAIG